MGRFTRKQELGEVGRKKLKALAVGAFVVFLGTGAWASIPDDGGVIHTCYSQANGTWRPIDYPAQKCRQGEVQLDINQKGVKGDPGEKGDTGPAGPAGPPGSTQLSCADELRIKDAASAFVLSDGCVADGGDGSGSEPPPPPLNCDDGNPYTVDAQRGEGCDHYATSDYYQDDDGDGVANGDEIAFYGTDPLNPDTDGDGISDGQEVVPPGEGGVCNDGVDNDEDGYFDYKSDGSGDPQCISLTDTDESA